MFLNGVKFSICRKSQSVEIAFRDWITPTFEKAKWQQRRRFRIDARRGLVYDISEFPSVQNQFSMRYRRFSRGENFFNIVTPLVQKFPNVIQRCLLHLHFDMSYITVETYSRSHLCVYLICFSVLCLLFDVGRYEWMMHGINLSHTVISTYIRGKWKPYAILPFQDSYTENETKHEEIWVLYNRFTQINGVQEFVQHFYV